MKTLRWSRRSSDQLQAIYLRIREDSEPIAAKTIGTLLEAAEQLRSFPFLGRERDGSRELIQPPYLIVYDIDADVVNIEAVLHGKQRY